MKLFSQFFIILVISFLGELLHFLIPLTIPASIYGLVLMLLALTSGILPLDKVKEAGRFLIEIMPMMFIPTTVGLLESWDTLQPILLSVSLITVVTTVLVMGVSGRITQLVMDCRKSTQKTRKESICHE